MDVRDRVAAGLLLDGGLATELERAGADLGDELWSARVLLEEPARIRAAHTAFFHAGADVAITASYQVSYDGFGRAGLDRAETARLLTWSVRLARDAAGEVGGDRLVAASVGPYGASLADGSEYVGDYGLTAAELAAWHRPRLEVLVAAGADLLAVETIPSIVEAEAIVALLGQVPEARAWVAFSCRDGARISDGTALADAAALAASIPQVVAVGVNCTPPAFVPSLLASAAGTGAALLAYPNVGSTWDATARAWRAEGPRPDLAAASVSWRAAGATLVGGCCGVTPDDIAAIAAVGSR
ncbi:MAG TPA: homocysteine S-methyltransferase [Actinomycetota bacterium]|nr:homocysteine S-methyltransferase [Actinomycetota bacterium]